VVAIAKARAGSIGEGCRNPVGHSFNAATEGATKASIRAATLVDIAHPTVTQFSARSAPYLAILLYQQPGRALQINESHRASLVREGSFRRCDMRYLVRKDLRTSMTLRSGIHAVDVSGRPLLQQDEEE
jgi:hypothetical protein